jgi:purine-nucleoside phosphorylase
MEAAALYMNAAVAKKNAIAVCTVSDHIIRGESLDSDARQSSFTDMMKIALNVAASI